MNKEQPALKQDIGLFFALSLVIGTIIGSGVFMKPGNVLSYSGSSDIALFAWLLGGILTLAGGLTVAEIGTQIPRTGGLYAYLEEVYGEFLGIFMRLGANYHLRTCHHRCAWSLFWFIVSQFIFSFFFMVDNNWHYHCFIFMFD